MSNYEFLSLKPERHRAGGSGEGETQEESDNNPAKRRRGDTGSRSGSTGRMTPWRKSSPYPVGVVGLHEEILDYYQFMSPLTEEKDMRRDLVSRVGAAICGQWPHAKIEIFGSFRTGLFLPSSDIDLVVFGDWEQLPLRTLGDLLVSAGISKPGNIRIIDSARVPIVKLTDRQTNIKVDISFNMTTGVASAQMTKDYTKQFSVMPKLVLVLKQFLIQRDLNEVFTGGISSYSLILLVVNFLQVHCRKKPEGIAPNLGVLLMEFFELYGRNFNYESTAIRIANGGSYFSKTNMADDHPLSNPSFLTIEDPLDETNDISRASWGAKQVKTAFEHAHSVLSGAVLEGGAETLGQSILGRIVQVDESVIDFRRTSVRQWRAQSESPPPQSSYSSVLASSAVPQHPGEHQTHVRRHSSPVGTVSEGQPTSSQLTYAAAAGAGRGENTVGERSARSNSCSSNLSQGDGEASNEVISLSGSSSSLSSAGSGAHSTGSRAGDSQAASGDRSESAHASAAQAVPDDAAEASVRTRAPRSRIHSYQDNSKGSIAKSHNPKES